MSHFSFLKSEWPEIHFAAAKAEVLLSTDPRTACFYARRSLELAVNWLYEHDTTLGDPYAKDLSARIHENAFRNLVGPALLTKIKIVKDLGNQAVHSNKPVPPADALAAVRELFHIQYWFARTYARTAAARPSPDVTFDPRRLPPSPQQVHAQTQAQVKQLADDLAAKNVAHALLEDELKSLRAEVAAAKAANAQQPDTHDYSEAQTRDTFIDLLLKEVGWPLDQPQDREFALSGMPTPSRADFSPRGASAPPNPPRASAPPDQPPAGTGRADYVLWSAGGLPLAVIEAKRTKRDATAGQQQAKLYADCLEAQYGQRPVIFYTNGHEHWLWDDTFYPPRLVQGFLKRDELELLIQRRQTRRRLSTQPIDPAIVERFYQTRAIRRIGDAFDRDHQRRALVVMATGAGKTRTVIALCDQLMQANWAKRILFLADRVALVNQAVKAFKKFLPSAAPVNLITERNTEGRVYVSTYPTMMGLINDRDEWPHRFGPGHFDLIIIDEAHRSIYQKYGNIFRYFDSLLVGLTATPRDESDHDTYELFHLETGVPTDAYEIEQAVADGFLVPPRGISAPLQFQRDGIRYRDLSEEERNRWDELEWGEDEEPPPGVEPEAVNRWFFNQDTVDKVLAHLMSRGQRVAQGDRLGKTIIFAKNEKHAQYIRERFDENYPHYKGEFARVVTFHTEHAQSLIDNFSKVDKAPHIAISVDMLDTGIDVPEVVNLVFFKVVRSKTKFWQMVGRGTRLCPDLFGPGQDKQFFYIFDYCQNLEHFATNPPAASGAASLPLGQRLFLGRVELIAALEGGPHRELRDEVAAILREQVAGMNIDNFLVRPHRRMVEKYSQVEAWQTLDLAQQQELEASVSGLPSAVEDNDTDAKLFDHLVLRLQLAVLRSEPSYTKLRRDVLSIAGALAEMDAIPMVHQRMALIHDLLTDAYWQDITAPMLESMRRQLRDLVKLIVRQKRLPVYTNFQDEMGAESEVELFGITAGDFERFRQKARHYLRHQLDQPVVRKVTHNEPLTPADLAALEQLLLHAGIATPEDLAQAKETAEGFGLFIRTLTGLDRETAKAAMDQFLHGRRPAANQIEFINQIVDHLTDQGYMNPELLYEPPYTDQHPHGVEGLFPSAEVDELVEILRAIKTNAAVA